MSTDEQGGAPLIPGMVGEEYDCRYCGERAVAAEARSHPEVGVYLLHDRCGGWSLITDGSRWLR